MASRKTVQAKYGQIEYVVIPDFSDLSTAKLWSQKEVEPLLG